MVKRIDYNEYSKISPKDAWRDIKWDFSENRFFDREEAKDKKYGIAEQFVHVFNGQFVNLVRLLGVSDRDLSQDIGRIVHILFWVGVLSAVRW